MQALKSIRPSNLVILFASPFLVYLFFVSADYLRSLRAILGIEDNALQQFIAYLVLLAVLVLGFAAPALRYFGRLDSGPWRLRGWAAAVAGLLLALYAAFWLDMSAFVNSVVSNSVDPFTSTMIVPAKTPRQLTPEALAYCLDFLRSSIKVYIAAATVLTAQAFKSDTKPVWCPGCGDFSVLSAITKALPMLALRPENVAIVSGIGCSSRIPAYTTCYGFHGVHGRALPVGTGLKVARPDLTVVVTGGDGDVYSIGGNHFMHACRRNVDLTYIVMDNHVYGMT